MADTGGRAQALHMHKKFSQYDWLGFTAQEFPIEIVPKFSMRAVSGVGRQTYGPFAPNYPTEVPLWLALHFRECGICIISTPEFLRVPFLTDVLEKDRANEAEYQLLPYHFFEIATQLIRAAKADIPNVTEVIRLVSEIGATRRLKLMQSVGGFSETINLPALKLTNLVSFEIECLRSSLALSVNGAEAIELRSQSANALPLVKGGRSGAAGGGLDGVGAGGGVGIGLSQPTPARTDITDVTPMSMLDSAGRPITSASEADYGSVGQQLAYGGAEGLATPGMGTQLSQQTDLTSVAQTSVTATTATVEAPAAPKKRRTLRQQ